MCRFFNVAYTASAWLVAGVALERFMAVWFPLHAKLWCTVKRAVIIVIAIPILLGVIYAYNFWTWHVSIAIMLTSHCPEVDPRWTHEYVPSAAPSGFVWYVKDVAISPEVDPDAEETQLGLYDGLRCAPESSDVFMMFYGVLMTTSELWESVRPA